MAGRRWAFGGSWRAALYDWLLGPFERRVMPPFRRQVAGGASGTVLEIGAGTGFSFPYFNNTAGRVVGAEPDPGMLGRAVARLRRSGTGPGIPAGSLTLVQARAEALPFAAESFDTVVCTHVLCSVRDLDAALAEVRRVLRPGGRFRFLEHVRAAEPGWARFQDAVTPVWSRLAMGCHPNRSTLARVEATGFRVQTLQRFSVGLPPVHPHILGTAVKPALKQVAKPSGEAARR